MGKDKSQEKKKPVGRPRAIDSPETLSGVYGLIEPNTGMLKYIGQSKNIYKRYKQHLRSNLKSKCCSWIKSILSKNQFPDLIIIELHKNPIEIEKYWIDRAKLNNVNLLNIHEGGLYPSHAHESKQNKLWNVDGLNTPYIEMRNFYVNYINRNVNIKNYFSELSKERKQLKSDLDILAFEIKVAKKAYLTGYENLKKLSLNWLLKINKSIPSEYKHLLKIDEFDDGYLIS